LWRVLLRQHRGGGGGKLRRHKSSVLFSSTHLLTPTVSKRRDAASNDVCLPLRDEAPLEHGAEALLHRLIRQAIDDFVQEAKDD